MDGRASELAYIGALAFALSSCWRPRPNDAVTGRWAQPGWDRGPLAAAEAQAGASIQASWDAPGFPLSVVGVHRDGEGQDSASDILTEDTELSTSLEEPPPAAPTPSEQERDRYRARLVPAQRCLHAADGGLVEGPCGSPRDAGLHADTPPAPSEPAESEPTPERYRGRLVPTRR